MPSMYRLAVLMTFMFKLMRCDTGTDDSTAAKFVQMNIQDSLNSLQKQLNYETSTRLKFDKDLTDMARLYRVMNREHTKLKQDVKSLMNMSVNTDQLTNLVNYVQEMKQNTTTELIMQEKFARNLQDNLDILSSQVQLLNKTMLSLLPNINRASTGKPEDCKDILSSEPNSRSGVYTIYPEGKVGYSVYCDMTSQGGGWTVIQRRINGALHFNKTWNEYKDGFGDLLGEHWIGNDVLHLLTKRGRTLLIRVLGKDSGSTWKYARYSDVHVSDEASKYRLTFRQGSYLGNAGDDFERKGGYDHNNMMFSTKDRDNDRSSVSCARRFEGGWWFNSCYGGCLNCKRLYGNRGAITFKSSWMMIK